MNKHLRYNIVLLLLLTGNTMAFGQMAMPDTVCVGATKNYSVNDPSVPSSYTWKINGITQSFTKNEMVITWNTTGTFQITVQERSAAGCDGDIQSGLVYVNNGNRRDTTVTACNSFTWNRNGLSYAVSGNYDYITNGIYGCPDTVTLKLAIISQVTPTFTQIGPLCQNSIATALPITSSNGITGTWSPAIINTSTAGVILYTFTPTLPCAATATMSITIIPGIMPVRYPAVNVAANISRRLQARNFTPADQYLWSPAVGLDTYTIVNPIFNYDRTTEYLITVNTAAGCSAIDTLLVTIIPSVSTVQFSEVSVPKAFSPNGDGHNDKLTPLLYKIKEFKYFRVFNRWGQIVFETKITGDGWDGTFNGKPQGADVFTWILEATGTDGRTHNIRGQSLLLR